MGDEQASSQQPNASETANENAKSFREVSLSSPPIDKLTNTLRGLMQDAANQHPNEPLPFGPERQQFAKAHTVIFDANARGGIGDAIVALRFARIAAKKFPDKKFYFVVHPDLLSISNLNLSSFDPEKIELTTTIPLELLSDSGVFIVEENPEKRLPAELIAKLEDGNRMVEMPPFPAGDVATLVTDLPLETPMDDLPYSISDVHYATFLMSLGIPITDEDLQESLLTPLSLEEKYDLLIAADAREYPYKDGSRSQKSLSPSVWKEIFQQIAATGRSLKIGILLGTAHQAYCEDIIRMAIEAGIKNVITVSTPTFGDLADEINRARMIVVADSAPAHLANEIARADPFLQVREIFLRGPELHEAFYGIRGIGDKGKIFAIADAIHKGAEEPDLAALAPSIARFMTS